MDGSGPQLVEVWRSRERPGPDWQPLNENYWVYAPARLVMSGNHPPDLHASQAMQALQNASNGLPLHDLLANKSSAQRKEYPVKTGVLDYFRDAIFRVAKVSYDGNQKHNPGQPLHWSRVKSGDHGDCHVRHTMCDDLEIEAAEAAWRALAHLQLLLEKKYNIAPPPGCK